MSGFALTQEQVVEVLSVYATAETYILAVETTPGWYVLGAFTMPASADVRVDVIGAVSDEGVLTLRTRLFDVTEGFVGPVSGSDVLIATEADLRAFSGVIELTKGHQYQFQSEVTGDEDATYYGVVRRATLIGA